MPENYDVVAAEYYDSERHPTCANFRDASKSLLKQFIGEWPKPIRICLEVGAGDSVIAELFVENGQRLNGLMLTDASPGMLAYSSPWAELGAKLVVARADELPVKNASVDVIASSLGDPYNTSEFWAEIYRCLRVGGDVFFTTPSFEWTSSYRPIHRYPLEESEFLLASGLEVTLPSVVLPIEEQVALVHASGFQVTSILKFDASQLTEKISTKLLRNGRAEGTVVIGYHAVKLR